jgi:hypothetical protein
MSFHPLVAVPAAARVNMVLGAMWYSPLLFAKRWMALAHPGKTDADLAKGARPAYVVAAVSSVISAGVLLVLLKLTGTTNVGDAVGVAALAWVGFTGSVMLTNSAFGQRSWMLTAIDSGYWLVGFILMAIVIALLG